MNAPSSSTTYSTKTLDAAGTNLQHAVEINQFPISRDVIDPYHIIRPDILQVPRPASTSVVMPALLAPTANIEMDLLAILPEEGFRKEGVSTDKIPQPLGGYAPAIRVGDFVFVAGQGRTCRSRPATQATSMGGERRVAAGARRLRGIDDANVEGGGAGAQPLLRAGAPVARDCLRHVDRGQAPREADDAGVIVRLEGAEPEDDGAGMIRLRLLRAAFGRMRRDRGEDEKRDGRSRGDRRQPCLPDEPQTLYIDRLRRA
jgi:enamine deaminase RidA (YjgF/YER057c/UK114 family)